MAYILVVDDDHDILRMMEFTLKRAGHNPVITTNGAKGLEIVSNNPPQLIIVDIMMPKMTGYEFTRQVRNLPDGADLPIIIYSARAQSVDRQAALEAGATDYMPKTVSLQEITEKIEVLLGDDLIDESAAKPAQTLACFSLRGGVGVTTLAVNQAVILAVTQKTDILLADLNPLAGHASMYLGLKPVHYLPALIATNESITPNGIKAHATAHASRVQLLASPFSGSSNDPLQHIDDLAQAAKEAYRFTIFDLPHNLFGISKAFLGSITKIMLLLSPDVPSLQSAISGLNHLKKLGVSDSQVAIILNHYSDSSSLKTEVIEKALSVPITSIIPFENDMPAAINASKPLVLFKQKSPASTALARLTAKIIQ